MNKTQTEKSENILPLAILIILAFVLIYLISLGKWNLLSENSKEKRRKLEDRKKLVDQQYLKIEKILLKKRQLKQKLDSINKKVLMGARIVAVFLFFTGALILKSIFQLTILDLTGYVGLLFLVLTFIAFIVFGSPSHAIEFWNYIEKMLTLKIYGKYLNIEIHFERHESEKSILSNESLQIQNQIDEMKQAETNILKILADNEIHN